MKDAGVYRKFEVRRTDGRDGPGGDRQDAEYFVLDVVHDKFAKAALLSYSYACRTEYPKLAEDMVRRYNLPQPAGLTLDKAQVEALKEVLRISDRSHESWDILKAALK